VPISSRTMASYRGPKVYAFDTEGGLSWGAPYLLGLAALALQIDPDLTPARIRALWVETAFHAKVGPVVNPRGLIEAASRARPDRVPGR